MPKYLRRLLVSGALAVAAVAGSALPASANTALLGYGSAGKGVECVQYFLARYAAQDITVDGVYGWQTRQAVINFQRYFHLRDDGIVGPRTGQKIHDIWQTRTDAELAAPGFSILDLQLMASWKNDGCAGQVPLVWAD
jgi:peptidoglycan hydrolase-like protein with peptidoglycan-binding domain